MHPARFGTVAGLVSFAAASGCVTTPPPSVPAPHAPVAQRALATGAPPSEAVRAPDRPPPAVAPPPAAAPLPGGTTVLAIGDSMADALGTGLRGELPALGIRAVVHAKESTYIPDWAGPTLNVRGLVQRTQPDLVVIALGGNETALADASLRAKDVTRIVDQLEGRPCVWVAPPVAEPKNGIFSVIRANSKPCRFFDTSEQAPPLERTGDHIHPTYPARRVWAKALLDWIAREREPNASRPFELKPWAPDDARASAPLAPAARAATD